MSVIVVVRTDVGLHFAADSALTDPDTGDTCAAHVGKLWQADDYTVVGLAGDPRVGQLIRLNMQEELQELLDLDSGIVFAANLATMLRYERVKRPDFELLIGHGERLFTLWSDYTVALSQTFYASIGSGAPYALGALFAVNDFGLSARDATSLAVQASCKHHTECMRPVVHAATRALTV